MFSFYQIHAAEGWGIQSGRRKTRGETGLALSQSAGTSVRYRAGPGPGNEIHPNYNTESPQNVTTKNASMHLSAFELDCNLINDSRKNKT
jgi:hypothetical protein